jgi:hypothetical protein
VSTAPSTVPTFLPTRAPATSPFLHKASASEVEFTTPDGVMTKLSLDDASDGGGWVRILDQINAVVTVNPGSTVINALFRAYGTGLVRYHISGTVFNYYRRTTPWRLSSWDLYSNLANTWSSAGRSWPPVFVAALAAMQGAD